MRQQYHTLQNSNSKNKWDSWWKC